MFDCGKCSDSESNAFTLRQERANCDAPAESNRIDDLQIAVTRQRRKLDPKCACTKFSTIESDHRWRGTVFEPLEGAC